MWADFLCRQRFGWSEERKKLSSPRRPVEPARADSHHAGRMCLLTQHDKLSQTKGSWQSKFVDDLPGTHAGAVEVRAIALTTFRPKGIFLTECERNSWATGNAKRAFLEVNLLW